MESLPPMADEVAEPTAGAAAGPRPAIRLTGRGAIVLMLAVFTVGVLAAGWLGSPAVAGVSFLAGSAGAVWYARKADLLLVAVSPPTLLCIVLVVVNAVTASGGVALSVAEGTAVTLAGAAPWLFAGTALSLIIAAARGLRGPIGELRQNLPRQPEPATALRRDHATGD
jgi:hypothetical protein